MSKHHLLSPLLTSQCFHRTQGTSRIDGIFLLCNYLNGDITHTSTLLQIAFLHILWLTHPIRVFIMGMAKGMVIMVIFQNTHEFNLVVWEYKGLMELTRMNTWIPLNETWMSLRKGLITLLSPLWSINMTFQHCTVTL